MSRAERLWIGGLGVYLTAWLLFTTWEVSRELPAFAKVCEADDNAHNPEQAPPAAALSAASPATPSPSPATSVAASPAAGALRPTPAAPPTPTPTPRSLDASERRIAVRALQHPYLLWLLGCLGASVSALWAFVRRVGEQPEGQDRLSRRWLPYYVVRPLIGGVVGVISVLGLDFLQFRPTSWAPLLFFAFAAGLVSRQATLKLREISLSLFTSQEYVKEKVKVKVKEQEQEKAKEKEKAEQEKAKQAAAAAQAAR